MTTPELSANAVASVAELGREAWDGLVVARRAIPFLHHGFLSALEETHATGGRSGWGTSHLVVRAGPGQPASGRPSVSGEGGALAGIAPAFIKSHSLGEFVYDWAWADAAQRARIAYYPKLVLAAPFSPVAGERLLVAPGLAPAEAHAVRRRLLAAAIERARELGCSGVHLLFCHDDEVRLAETMGFVHRLGCQYHWRNEGYADFEAFLARFDSKRRNQIRRERRRVREQGVTVRSLAGEEVEDRYAAPAYDFYVATIERFAWGRRYLNRRFFDLLWRRMRPYLQVTLAERNGEVVGGSLNLESLPHGTPTEGPEGAALGPGATRFGRYWGALAEVHSLHFEVCAYAAIEDCIGRGIVGFEAGAGGEEHKLGRGFLPQRTHSAHLLFDPRLHEAIADFCRREARHVEDEIAQASTQVFVR